MHSKKLYLYIRRESGQRSHCQRKRRTEGKCYYKWRSFNKAHKRFLSHYQTRLLEAFAIPATEDDELARHLIIEAAIAARKAILRLYMMRRKRMKNEEAIRHLEDLHRLYLGNEKFTTDIEAIETDIEAIEIAIEALKKQPTRPTGHWIEKEDYNLDTYYECSECGADYCIEGDILIHKYCPNCGARMEAEE